MTTGERRKALVFGDVGGVVSGDDHGGGRVPSAIVRCAPLLAAGLLTGAIFGAWLTEHAFRGGASFYTELKQLQIRTLTVPLPALGVATMALGLLHLFLVRKNPASAGLTLAGVLCFAVCFVITVRGHFPINAQIMDWSGRVGGGLETPARPAHLVRRPRVRPPVARRRPPRRAGGSVGQVGGRSAPKRQQVSLTSRVHGSLESCVLA